MTQDPTIGVVTRDDLKEGIRVNEALLKTARGDVECLENRLANADGRIAEQIRLKEQWREFADTAPERIERITAALAHQRRLLAEFREPERPERAGISQANREERVAALSARLAKGDQTALAELLKLARG